MPMLYDARLSLTDQCVLEGLAFLLEPAQDALSAASTSQI